jgi:hypothetical protein
MSLFITRLMQKGTLIESNCNTDVSSKGLSNFLHLTVKLCPMLKTDVLFGKIILEHAACNIFFHSPSEQYILYEWGPSSTVFGKSLYI